MKQISSWATEFNAKEGRCVLACNRKGYYWGVYWCARIIGTHKKYGLNRQFVNGTNQYTYSLSAGIYDVYRAPRKNAAEYERYFLSVSSTGEAHIIDGVEAIEYAHDIQRQIDNSKEIIGAADLCLEPLPF